MPHDLDDVPQLMDLDPNRPWYRIENAAGSGERSRAKVHLFDAIGGWFGVRAADFVRELNELDVDEIELRLNSPGGQVWDGIAIMNALRAHRARVEVHVDGIAASIASVIAMAGDDVIMSRGAQMMIHDGAMIVWGPAAAMHKAAGILDKISDNIAGVYAKRAGGEAADWRALMVAETWYNADEAVEAGLADRTEDSDDVGDAAASIEHQFDLSMFQYPGRDKAPAPLRREDLESARATYPAEGFSALLRMATGLAAHQPPATEPGSHHNQKEEAMSFDTLMAGLRERLGITDAETGEDAVLAALDGHLTDAQATATPPAGTVLIDQGVLNQLRNDAQDGREARAQQIADRRDRIIATAMQEGRISGASAEAFRSQLDKDEAGTVAILNSLPKDTVPVTEIGTSQGGDAEDALYRQIYPSKEA